MVPAIRRLELELEGWLGQRRASSGGPDLTGRETLGFRAVPT